MSGRKMSDGKTGVGGQPSRHLLVMAAGTGGHIFPGLAIADTMRARGWSVSWLGTERGMECDLVPKHGIEMDRIGFSGLRGKGWRHTVGGAFKLLASFFTCFGIMGRRRPDVVLGMGGYVTVPGGVAARLRGVPLALVNADAGLLLSNKTLAPLAQRVLFGFPSETAGAGGVAPAKALVTGNPVRQEILALADPEARYGARQGPLRILVVGGSLGAKALNDCLPQALALIPAGRRPLVVHQSGKQHIAALREAYRAAGVEAELLDFIDDMASRYAEADLVVCRAGAITLSELTGAGIASLLVPFVASTTSHQRGNAEWMARERAALHVAQDSLQPQALADILCGLSRGQCQTMALAARALGRRDASLTIAAVLEQLASKTAKTEMKLDSEQTNKEPAGPGSAS